MLKTPDHELIACVCFAIKHAGNKGLMNGLSHIVLSVLVRLTDIVPKNNGPNQIYFKNFYFAQKTYRFILSCDQDNIETVLISPY